METQLGDDFSDVRIYHDHGATLLGVNAYTEGSEIHFAPGFYNPHTSTGRELIAHELAHVIQQREGQDD